MSGLQSDPVIFIPTVTAQSCLATAFSGLPTATLQQFLTQAQTALNNLLNGGQPQVVSYGEGSGQKSVTYARTNEWALRRHIRELQQLLGQAPRRRAGFPVF